jgi:seryl-tRNA synthetase
MAPDTVLRATSVGEDGRATLGPGAIRLLRMIDANFALWGAAVGADEYQFPPVVAVADLDQMDYFDNFPHLVSPVSALDRTLMSGAGLADGTVADGLVAASALVDAGYVLPSAACYSAYFAMQDSTVVNEAAKVTTVATCFRREDHYEGLRRLFGFTMREIICIGARDAVLDHLSTFKARISGFLDEVGVPHHVEIATDPFFDPNGARSKMQQLFPTKEEFLYDSKLAIASVNFHRNFFGERCQIRLPDGSPAFTGCVAFGLERWVCALGDLFTDNATIEQRLSLASDWALRPDDSTRECEQ